MTDSGAGEEEEVLGQQRRQLRGGNNVSSKPELRYKCAEMAT